MNWTAYVRPAYFPIPNFETGVFDDSWLDAFRRSKSTNAKELTEAIRQTNITDRAVLGGVLKFNAKGQVEGNLSACAQNLNGVPRVVLPESAAEAKPVFPAPDHKKA